MRTIDVSTTVKRDGELRIRSRELRAGQHVDAKLVLRDDTEERHSIMELRGLFKGTWGSAEAIDLYLRRERDAWER